MKNQVFSKHPIKAISWLTDQHFKQLAIYPSGTKVCMMFRNKSTLVGIWYYHNKITRIEISNNTTNIELGVIPRCANSGQELSILQNLIFTAIFC